MSKITDAKQWFWKLSNDQVEEYTEKVLGEIMYVLTTNELLTLYDAYNSNY